MSFRCDDGSFRREFHKGRKAVIYVTTQGFLYPTLVSALQVEKQMDRATTDVILFLVDVTDQNMHLARTLCEGRGISVRPLAAELFSLPPDVAMLPSHVPLASLARLVVHQILEPIYDRVLYLDGDTLITGDIRPLLAFDPPRGTIAAVRGSVWLTRTNGQTAASTPADSYIQRLGLREPDNYFNAGILSLWREDLERIGAQAFAYFTDNPELCRFHDQSALNHVCDGRVTELWAGFNYHVPYQNLLAVHIAKPAIIHFTGPVKPWTYRIRAFSEFSTIYDRFDQANPLIARWRIQARPEQQSEIVGKLFRSTVRERLSIGRWLRNRRKLRQYLDSFGGAVSYVPSERRRYKRVDVDLRGRLTHAGIEKHPCRVTNISPGDAAILTPSVPETEERVTLQVDQIGRLEGVVTRVFSGGFAISLHVSESASSNEANHTILAPNTSESYW